MSDAAPIVFVVDDDESVRNALRRLITSAAGAVEFLTKPFRDNELLDVMAGVISRLPIEEIAAHFGITEAAVEEQRANVMLKMRAGSLADLIHIESRLGTGVPGPSNPTKVG